MCVTVTREMNFFMCVYVCVMCERVSKDMNLTMLNINKVLSLMHDKYININTSEFPLNLEHICRFEFEKCKFEINEICHQFEKQSEIMDTLEPKKQIHPIEIIPTNVKKIINELCVVITNILKTLIENMEDSITRFREQPEFENITLKLQS